MCGKGQKHAYEKEHFWLQNLAPPKIAVQVLLKRQHFIPNLPVQVQHKLLTYVPL